MAATRPLPGEAPEFIRAIAEHARAEAIVRHEVNLMRTWVASGYTEMAPEQIAWMLECFTGEERAGQRYIAHDLIRCAHKQLSREMLERALSIAAERQDNEAVLLIRGVLSRAPAARRAETVH